MITLVMRAGSDVNTQQVIELVQRTIGFAVQDATEKKVKGGEIRAAMLRQERINTHGVVLRALGGLGQNALRPQLALMETFPDKWEAKLEAIREVDWRKSVGNKVNPEWENACFYGIGRNDLERAGIAELAKEALKMGWITKEDFEAIERAREYRNPVTHFRRPGHDRRIETRAFTHGFLPYEIIENDARHVIQTVFHLLLKIVPLMTNRE
jgi:hypothetical protein